ncbi:DUF3829 domain-containing protein [Escherichia coli]|nr:DUF3829 domain-containing protein [Escherichia coli]
MDKYYTQENYKDDAFAKGKTLHQTFLKNLEAFEPVAESYHAAIQEINDKRQLAELKNIEEREGKTFHYYSLAVMISAKQINNLISQEKFDVDAAMKKVSELETLVAQAKEADKGGMNFSFINSAGQYQLEAKKYVRRVRDKVPYSDWDKEQLQDANSSWMVDDSFPRALREYNEMDKYYTQENYKDDAFAKGKTLHQTFLKNLEAFEAVAESYHAAIQEINDKRQLAELKNIEEREGKTFHYYSLAVMISAKQINNLISQDKFDAEAAMKKVSELETLVAQAKEADKGGMNFSFINSAGQYQLEAKKYVRRVRDKVPYSDWDKEQLQDANSSWMVDDSFPRALREYNEMVDDYNSLR